MAELTGKGLTYEKEVNVFNLAEISEATIRQDIDYIMHVEHEVPTEWWTKLEEVKEDIVHNLIIHADAAIRRKLYDLSCDITEKLRDDVHQVVKDALPVTREKVMVSESHDLSGLMG